MGLWLIEAAHYSKPDPDAILFHESRDNRMKGTLARPKRVGMVRFQREQRAAIVEHEPGSMRDQARSESHVIALDQRRDISASIHHAHVNGVGATRVGYALELRGL